jgi:hypothetical protein
MKRNASRGGHQVRGPGRKPFIERIPDLCCCDCGVDTMPLERDGGRDCCEYYMVHNDVWRAAGMQAGVLCIGCLEGRLGRRLTPQDFTNSPINNDLPWDTARLAERLLIIRRLGIGEATIYLHQWRSANLLMRRGFITVKKAADGFGYAALTDSGKETLAMVLTAPAGSREAVGTMPIRFSHTTRERK